MPPISSIKVLLPVTLVTLPVPTTSESLFKASIKSSSIKPWSEVVSTLKVLVAIFVIFLGVCLTAVLWIQELKCWSEPLFTPKVPTLILSPLLIYQVSGISNPSRTPVIWTLIFWVALP